MNIPEIIKSQSYWFIFYENELMVNFNKEEVEIPFCEDLGLAQNEISFIYPAGILKEFTYNAVSLKSKPEAGEKKFLPLRSLLGRVDDDIFHAAGRSFQILNWNNNHSFCGRCGTTVLMKQDELAKYCPSCRLVVYPRISPAVIVAVTRGDEILLAHSGRFKSKMYSVLAGFVEPGETFEQCVAREIFEEVNIRVHNIRYFSSQPWPFPDSIMVGFTADYLSGEIKPDGKEIIDAGWYKKDSMPEIPGKWSIAGKLIDSFLKK